MAPPIKLSRSQCSDGFKSRGWVKGNMGGGDLYFDGNGGNQHPHFHLTINGDGGPRDIRAGVSMLAWSDGGQHLGGGGTTYIHNANVMIRVWQPHIQTKNMNANMTEEFAYIMSYFTQG